MCLGGAFVLFVMRPPIDYRGRLLVWSLSLISLFLAVYFVWTLVAGPPTFVEMFQPIAALFGKDITLTGRSSLWVMVLEEAINHPIQGIGFGAFWLGPDSRAGWIIDIIYWIPWQGHNAYIDILNETGAIGLTLVMAFLIFHMRQLAKVAKIDQSALALHGALFIYLVFSNIVETELFRPITIHLVLVTMSSFALTRSLLEMELRAATIPPAGVATSH